jgi:hypothetical protein
MTAGQKKNIERLKKLQADAKKLKKANPKLSHIEAIRMAAGKKVGAYKIVEKNELSTARNTKVFRQKRLADGTFNGYKRIGSPNNQITYKGFVITKLFPSGYYEFYSDKQGRFIKFSTLTDAKKQITKEKAKISGTTKKYIVKSIAASKVLQLMDNDYPYQLALKEVLKSDKRLSKKKLEKELNNFI